MQNDAMGILEISYVAAGPQNVHLRGAAPSRFGFMSIDLSCRAAAGCGKNEFPPRAGARGLDYSRRRVFMTCLTAALRKRQVNSARPQMRDFAFKAATTARRNP